MCGPCARRRWSWLAVLAMEHRCGIASFDNGFSRFAGVRWSEPTP